MVWDKHMSSSKCPSMHYITIVKPRKSGESGLLHATVLFIVQLLFVSLLKITIILASALDLVMRECGWPKVMCFAYWRGSQRLQNASNEHTRFRVMWPSSEKSQYSTEIALSLPTSPRFEPDEHSYLMLVRFGHRVTVDVQPLLRLCVSTGGAMLREAG
jgi:hypothetical protein